MNYPQGPYPPPNEPRHRQQPPPPYPQQQPPQRPGPPPQQQPQYGAPQHAAPARPSEAPTQFVPPRPDQPRPPQHRPPEPPTNPYPHQYGGPPQHGAPQQPQYGAPQQQFGAPQPQYGAPQQQFGAPQGDVREGVLVNTEYFPLAFMMLFFKPKFVLDGQELGPRDWGRTPLPATPGQHHVHVYVPYLFPSKIGPADATVNVAPGQLTELSYKAPLFAFSPGSLGEGPQKYNGVGITIAIMAIPFALIFLMIILSVILA